MAKKRKSASRSSSRTRTPRAAVRPPPSRPQNWFLEVGAERAREYQRLKGWSDERVLAYRRLKRISEAEYLRDAVLGRRDEITGKRSGGLRDYFKGFDASDGYNMRHIESLSAARARSIRNYAAYLHNLQAAPYIKVSPKSPAMRRALQDRTGQNLTRQVRYVYHTDKPGSTRVTYKKGELREIQKLPSGVELIQKYYFFSDYNGGRQPKTFRAMVTIARDRMLKKMPDVYYTFWTDLHGSIGAPFPKKSLLRELERYEAQYGTSKGFAEGLLGFVFQGTADQADSEYIGRLNRRARRTQQKTQESKVRQQRMRFLASARAHQYRRCDVIGRGGRCRLRMGHKGPHRFGKKR